MKYHFVELINLDDEFQLVILEHIVRIEPITEKSGCVVYFSDGSRGTYSDTYDEIKTLLRIYFKEVGE